MNINSKNNKTGLVLLLFGPTGVGKTELLFVLQKKLRDNPGMEMEVISCDSMQVYRGLDIGTAKPGHDEQYRLHHHLINIVDPDTRFDVGDFVRLSTDIIRTIIESKDVLPVISGGTAFYFRHYLYGLPDTPEASDDIRIIVKHIHDEYGNEGIRRMLEKVDHQSAERIHPNDSYRLCRALEVYYASGKPLSLFPVPDNVREDIVPLIIGLDRPRSELYARINRRVDNMFEKGLPEEVAGLVSKGFGYDAPGMKGIGYKEFFIDGEFAPDDLSRIKENVKTSSRRYAKRQITFFHSIPGVVWFNPDNQDQIADFILNNLEKNR